MNKSDKPHFSAVMRLQSLFWYGAVFYFVLTAFMFLFDFKYKQLMGNIAVVALITVTGLILFFIAQQFRALQRYNLMAVTYSLVLILAAVIAWKYLT